MKTLSATLLAAQKSPLRRPAVRCTYAGQTHPDKAASIQWGMLGWELLYSSGSPSPHYHGAAITKDGDTVYLHRLRTNGSSAYYQRITDPDESSNYGASWTDMGTITSGVPVSIAAYGSNVILVWDGTDPIPRAGVCFRLSTDHGATFSAETCINTAYRCRQAVNVFPRGSGWAIAIADTGAANLSIALTPLTPVHSTTFYPHGAPEEVHGIAGYYEGDYNLVTLILEGSYYRVSRVVYGNGYRVAAGTWSDFLLLNTGNAALDSEELVRQYLERQEPYSDFEELEQQYRAGAPWKGSYARYLGPGSPHYTAHAWEKVHSIMSARALDNLDLDAPFICTPDGEPPIVSLYREQDKWFFRLRPGTDFYDADWYKSYRQDGNCPYGLALATDGTYLWGTRANEVWRARLPGQCWPVPVFNDMTTSISTIYQKYILSVKEVIRRHARSELFLEVDTSGGYFSVLPAGNMDRGARLTFEYGYRTASGIEYGNANTYFVEDWMHSRTRNASSVLIHAIDAWGLLEQYTVPGPWEVNFTDDQYDVYELIDKVLQCIGGTLDYTPPSTGLYPRMEFHAGESGAGVLRRLLQLVPDVLMFNGFDAYLLSPQESDTYSYEYYFPAPLSGEHPILAGSYRQLSYGTNRAYVIGKDTEDYPVFGEAENAGEIGDVGERLQFNLQTDIATAALAEDVAEAVLARERIDAAYCSILVPPNCGQELWDVVRINDTPCGKANADYRVISMLLNYEDRDSAYSQRLTLGGV
jgi:hypothetical protein